jgi:SAM-dependent methyltransferase
MPKSDILTQAEFADFSPNERILHHIEAFRQSQNLRKEEMRLLDWGCGRGRSVLWMREQGYQAYGIDIDCIPIENALPLIREKGYPGDILHLLNENGKTDFPNNFFDFTFSGQVFEHVADMDLVAAEIQRITRPGGMGFHEYPSYRHVREPHLFMPIVHWLPKSFLRRWLIALYVRLGVEPHWPEVDTASLQKKIETYYRYSIEKTHYRKHTEIQKIFEQHGFDVTFETINHPRIQKHKIMGKLTRHKLTRGIVNYLLLTFRHQELSIKKQP